MNIQNATAAAIAIITHLRQISQPDEKVKLLLPQVATETGGFSSNEEILDNNLSGIKFFGQPEATQGRPVPASEYNPHAKYGNFYSHYADLTLWVKDYLKVLQKGADPLECTDITSFCATLKENGYMQADEAAYLHNLELWVNTFRLHLPAVTMPDGSVIPLV